MKKSFAISAGHEGTAEAARIILEEGGNAVDAAIAALLASFVAEPCMSSAGGGGFAQVHLPDGKISLVDFFCQTPQRKFDGGKADFYPVEVDFGEVREVFHIGMGSTAVPGSIAGIYEMHRQWGSMPMKVLVQPAIKMAREGVIVNDFQHEDFVLLQKILEVDPKAAPIFFPEGEFIKLGARQFMPEQADFLDYLGKSGPDFFYKGEIARSVSSDHEDSGGFLQRIDFESYRAILRKPLRFQYKNKQIYTNPLPSIGGMSILMAFALFDEQKTASDFYKKEHVKGLTQVFQQLDRFKKYPTAFEKWLEERNLNHIHPFHFGLPDNQKRGSTTHFNLVDGDGMAVSLTATNGEGCGYFVKDTGIQLNNMLGESALLPNGFHSWVPDTRLSSMMSPTLVLDKQQGLECVLGSGGASRIPTAVFQVLINLLEYNYLLDKAVQLPRLHFEHGELNIEAANDMNYQKSDLVDKIKEWSGYSLFFGGVHSLLRSGHFWEAIGDHRRDGVAISSDTK